MVGYSESKSVKGHQLLPPPHLYCGAVLNVFKEPMEDIEERE